MKLWIRSQDKIALSQIKQIAIEYDKKIVGYNGYCVKLGEYNTKERALEVLDEIQNLLRPMLIFKNCNCTQEMLDNIKEVGACVVSDNTHIEQMQYCVYEMPEE